MILRSCFVALCLGVLVAVGCGSPMTKEQAAAMGAPVVGAAAPVLSLTTLEGAKVELAELVTAGPVVFVQLRGWVTYQCPLCTKQVGDLVSRAAEFKAAGAQVILSYPGAAAGLDAHAKEFIANAGLPEGFHFGLDPDLVGVKAWGLHWDAPKETAYPATFVVDTGGVVRFGAIREGHGGRTGAGEVLEVVKGIGK